METGRDYRQPDRPAVQVLRRVWRKLPLPLRRVGGQALLRLERQIALLSARAARLAQTEDAARAVPPVDAALVDRLAKDQTALALRLLSIEQELARRNLEERCRNPRLSGTEDAPGHRPPAVHRAGAASQPTTVAFEDVGLNLITGPYGRFLVMAPDLIGATLERGEFWDAHLKPIIERCGDQGRAAIDAGAGVGFHTVFLARYFGVVHAFEPRVRCFHLLNANLELNGCDRVSTYNIPLSDAAVAMALANGEQQDRVLKMRGEAVCDSQTGNVAAPAHVADNGIGTPRIRSTTIDDLGLRDVGFIKVDTHGCDLRVLQGARRTIAAGHPAVVFGFAEQSAGRHGDTLEDFRQFFAECRYDLTEVARSGRNRWHFLAAPT